MEMRIRSARTAAFVAALASPMAALVLMREFPGTLDPTWMWFDVHFWTTGVTALAAAGACAIVVAAAKTLRETKLLFLMLAFLCIGGLFSVHGLLTPGVIKHEFHDALAVSAWVSIFTGAVFVALSATDLPARVDRVVSRAGIVIFAWVAILVGTYVALSWTIEDWLDPVPTDERWVQFAVGASSTGLIAFALWRYLQAWAFARLPAQAAMVAALGFLLQVPPILLWGEVWHASWWMYHAAYGAAFAALFAGWAMEWRRAGSLDAIAEALAMRDAVAQLDRGRDHDIVELVDAIEAKDYYTGGHVHRVGTMAYEIGKRMGLSQAQLREVVLAAQMHDVGKIWTPDGVLQKAGPLTDNEMAVMREHTVRGGEMATRVPALREASAAVRAHHERYDGAGYPDGLAGDAIPLAARIVSVADTYDAMTSTRPYRKALSHEVAVMEIRRVRGTQLDPRCVDAFVAAYGAHDKRPAA
jgi:HD-GYP domain-containing protein (c-di-GMP phosphodiesterase class II)